ncbi:MAG: hypothetical protein EAX96_16790 [Candidatus Lokiarchaeota archaeon]|nr:hypothetical protein [Candidatus Lokiarchaeota archaeon]
MKKRMIIEMGMGVDQHGHNNDPSNAAIKAIKDAISNNCLPALREILNITNPNRMIVDILIGCPFPDKINEKKVLRAVPFGIKNLKAVEGGLLVEGIKIPELGDDSPNMIVANAAITVSFDL